MDRGQADARHHRLKIWTAGAAALAALPGAAFAEDLLGADQGVLSLVVENDSLSSGADRNYTSGIKLAYISPADRVPGWLQSTGSFTRTISGSEPDFWGIAFGQSIFTPNDIQANPAPADQHPYAGWLYMQLMVAAEDDPHPGQRPRHLDTYELEIGVVGPWALGEEAQDSIHQLLGAPHPNGWDSQLHNEAAFDVSFERRWHAWRLGDNFPIEAELTPSLGITVGTLRDEARLGLTARIGQRIGNDYGPPRVRPSLAGVEHFAGGPLSWQLFAGIQGRAVAHDLFLDGNTFEDSAAVERIPYVTDYQAGFSVSAGDWRLAYTYVWRTDEFETQNGRQDFGALALSWRL